MRNNGDQARQLLQLRLLGFAMFQDGDVQLSRPCCGQILFSIRVIDERVTRHLEPKQSHTQG